ncbi:hypothetical protein [Avibacterium paragallinarum]|uniref:Sulfate transport protein cysz n=1 Tax=Avibacterium paragallinarum TaxID=728 RepID=A0A8B3TFZ7_AVIPA|nr:hypothetical protein [Avibacterium paragallinarum]RZN61387.1 hypothetical protein EIG79_01225 [Avibacterium paragallinarum]
MKRTTLTHPNPVLRGNNEMVLNYLSQVQKCIRKLEEMGLYVINVHFEHIKPKVRVQPNHNTKELEKTARAMRYILGNDGQRFDEWQMMVEGIKVVWRSYVQ